ncbi:3-oxoacyl-[ACP] synthase III in alkane synthesis cluster [hydrothermal vent metagenome]|uniref:3-oxoacyl-[ACP] synthase III in alkane synthesis cluster n=1 Tax=hydrothermal vent metagenome TaxID=652676 RepID=A0A3B1CD90_9ZZZZ
MKFNNVCLEALGYELPPKIVTSGDLEDKLAPLYDRLNLNKGRLEMMTGIRERRFWENGIRPSGAAIKAGEKAIEASGIEKEKFGAIFHASVCRDFLEPATANVVHHMLGLPPGAMVFDISNACLGVLNSIIILGNMIELGQVEAGVIVAGEMGETLVKTTIEALLADENATRQSIKPAFASLTIGSGAAAVVLAHKNISRTGHKIVGGVVRCATEKNHLCTSDRDIGIGKNSQPLMATDSEELLKEGCALAAKTWVEFKRELDWENEKIGRTFTHQVGSAHRKLLYESLGLPIENDFSTHEFLGNVGSVSLPLTLALGAEEGLLSTGDKVALLGIGSGLNCLMLGLEW